jgi:hypothetical protein
MEKKPIDFFIYIKKINQNKVVLIFFLKKIDQSRLTLLTNDSNLVLGQIQSHVLKLL